MEHRVEAACGPVTADAAEEWSGEQKGIPARRRRDDKKKIWCVREIGRREGRLKLVGLGSRKEDRVEG